jgi:hypothetical protein
VIDKPANACDLIGESGTTCPAGLPVPRGVVLTRRTLRSFAILAIIGLLMTGANMLWTAREVRVNNQRACSAVVADATIPLPHPVQGNPARLWESRFEANARARARQLGCEGV